MIYTQGSASSLKEVGERFLSFIQESNETTEAWEVIDDRLDSFYGATIKFKVDYTGETVSDQLNVILDKNLTSNIYVLDIARTLWTHPSNNNMGSDTETNCVAPDLTYVSNKFLNATKYCSLDVSQSGAIESDHTNIPHLFFHGFGYYHENNTLNNTYYKKLYNFLLSTPVSSLITNEVSTNASNDIAFVYLSIPSRCLAYEYYKDVLDVYYLLHKKFSIYLKSKFKEVHFYTLLSPDIENYTKIDSEKNILTDLSASYSMYRDSLVNFALDASNNVLLFDYTESLQTYDIDKYIPKVTSAKPQVEIALSVSSNNVGDYIKQTRTDITYNGDNIDHSSVSEYHGVNRISDAFISYIQGLIKKTKVSFLNTTLNTAYISLQFNEIKADTYRKWLFDSEDYYLSENFDHRSRVYTGGLYGRDLPEYYDRTLYTKQGEVPNIFVDTGQIMFITPHLTYDKNLYMCEQGGACCFKEVLKQEIADNKIPLRTVRVPRGGSLYEGTRRNLPPFPGQGAPSFTISDANLSECNNTIRYYFVRTNTSADIVIYTEIADEDSIKTVGRIKCQHMSFGRLDCFDMEKEFKYPLYVAGGNGGLTQDMYLFKLPYEPYNTHLEGNIYSLDMGNISLSNSNMLLSCAFNGSSVTNFRVFRPDGQWEDIVNCVQNATVKTPHLEAGEILQEWLYPLAVPTRGTGNNYASTLINGSDGSARIDTHLIKSALTRNIVEVPLNLSINAESSTPVNHMVVTLFNKTNNTYYGVIGEVPNCYSAWSRTLNFGEINIDGKKYLCIPNGWATRLWYYENYIGVYKKWENSDTKYAVDKVLDELYNNYYNNMIYDYVLILLEDGHEPHT